MKNSKLPHNHGLISDKIISNIPNQEQAEKVSDLFKLFSDPNRVKIFWILCHCEECVINISAMLQMSSPAVSHHLKLLKTAGLISGKRNGKEVYYTAASTVQSGSLHSIVETMLEMSCPAKI